MTEPFTFKSGPLTFRRVLFLIALAPLTHYGMGLRWPWDYAAAVVVVIMLRTVEWRLGRRLL